MFFLKSPWQVFFILSLIVAACSAPAAAAPDRPSSEGASPAEKNVLPGSVAPAWEKNGMEPGKPDQAITKAPLLEFDSSQSQWKRLEIGQAESYVRPDLPTGRAAASQNKNETTGSNSISRKLEDPEDRQQLRELSSDMQPPENFGASETDPAKVQNQAQPLPRTEGTDSPGGPAVAGTGGKDASAISKAGSFLATDEHYGETAILPPLKNDDAAKIIKPIENKITTPKDPRFPPAATPKKKAEGKLLPKKTPLPKPVPRKTGPPPVPAKRASLSIINETGRREVTSTYGAVLRQMGYTLVSTAEGTPKAVPSGQTIITYRPGLRAKALEVARHLPGRKVLVEAQNNECVPSEILINLR